MSDAFEEITMRLKSGAKMVIRFTVDRKRWGEFVGADLPMRYCPECDFGMPCALWNEHWQANHEEETDGETK